MYEFELTNACLKLLRDMFMMQPGETIAITCDTESSMEIVDATAQAAVILGAKPLVVKIAAPRGCGKTADQDMPCDSLVGAIKNADAWVEYNYEWIFYSDTYDRIIADPENRSLYNRAPQSIHRSFPIALPFLYGQRVRWAPSDGGPG